MRIDPKIEATIENRAESSPEWAKAYALLLIARGQGEIAAALHRLGTADAATPMGAIEFLSLEIKNGFERLASAIEDAAEIPARGPHE
jgi:hypothetical protein